MSDEQLLDLALGVLHDAGVEGEVYLERSTTTTIAVHKGKVERLEERNDHGAGIRVFADGRVAFSFTADLSHEGLTRAVETARAIAPHTKQDAANALPRMASRTPALVNLDPAIAETPITQKIEIARETERAARAVSPKIQRTREASYQDMRQSIHLANSAGGRLSHEASRAYVGIELAATEGSVSQTGAQVAWALGPSGLDPSAVGREAARRGLAKLGAQQPPTARTTVVLDPEATAGLFSALAGLFSADAVLKGKSLLAGRIGETIAAGCVTLIDDGGIAGGCASAPLDGEGVPTGESILVDRGILRGYLHNSFTATKMKVPPTGNGVRGGYTSAPEPSPTNLYLRPTGIRREALLASVATGIYVTEMMGLHTVNTTTGDFSLGAFGMRIENGRIGRAADRMAISGNVINILKSIEAVATDLTFLVSGGGSTVLLHDIRVSGAGS